MRVDVLSLAVQSDISASIAADLGFGIQVLFYIAKSNRTQAHTSTRGFTLLAADTRRAHVSDEYKQIRRCFSMLPTPPQLLISFLSFTRFH